MKQLIRAIKGICPSCEEPGLMVCVPEDPTSEEEGYIFCVGMGCKDTRAAQIWLEMNVSLRKGIEDAAAGRLTYRGDFQDDA